jgi:hypothetical protein
MILDDNSQVEKKTIGLLLVCYSIILQLHAQVLSIIPFWISYQDLDLCDRFATIHMAHKFQNYWTNMSLESD